MIFLVDFEGTPEVLVYTSLDDLIHRVEWQDIFEGKSYIIDELGNLYKWDDKQVKEFGTVHDYTLIPSGANIELAQLCKQTYESLDRPVEFSIKN